MADDGRIHIVIDGDASSLKKALTDVKSSLNETDKQAKTTGASVEKSTTKINQSLGSMAAKYLSVAAAAAVVAKTVKNIIEVNAQFERKISELASVLGTTKDGVEALNRAARELGGTTEFTASEVVDLQMALARLGFTQTQILTMEESVLKFASAVNADLGSAANFAGAALRGFGLEAQDTNHLLDVMAAATSKSALDFHKLETSIAIVAPVAHSFGLSVEDAVTLLGSLSNAGFGASMAATATRRILLNLADANGKLAKGLGHTAKTFPEIIAALKECQEKGIDLNDTLEMTDTQSVAAFSALISGADSADELRRALGDVDGTLNEMYETMTDNVTGAIRGLKSAWEALMLEFSNSDGTLKSILDFGAEFLRMFSGTDAISKEAAEIQAMALDMEANNLAATLTNGGKLSKKEKKRYQELLDSGVLKRNAYTEIGEGKDDSGYYKTIQRSNQYGLWSAPERRAMTDAEIKAYEVAQKKNNGGGGGGNLTDAQKKAIERYKEAYEKAVTQMWKEVDNSTVAAMQEGTAKKLAQIRNEEKQAIAAIDEEQTELEKTAKKAGKTVSQETYDQLQQRRENASKVARNKEDDVLMEQLQNQWDYLMTYGSYKERELAITKKYDEEIAREQDEFKKKILEKQKEAELAQNELTQLQETYGDPEDYNNVEKAKEATEKLYEAQIKVAQAKGDTAEAMKLQLELQKKLDDIDKRKGGKFYNVFRDTDRMNIVQIQEAIQTAEEQIEKMSADANAKASDIDAWRQALQNLKQAANDFSLPGFLKSLFSSDKDDPTKKASFAERIQAMKDAWSNMSSEEKWKNVGGWTSKIGENLGKAAEYMKQVAEVSGDSRLKEASEQLGAVAQNFAAAGGGAATGGWIGAIVGGASDMLSQTIQAISEAAVLEAQAKKNAEDWARALKNVGVEMDADAYESPFGERKFAKAIEAMRSSFEATKRYAEEIEALNKKYSEQEIEMLVYGGATSAGINTFLNPLGWIGGKNTISNEFKAYEDAIQKGYDGLQRMMVKTKDRSGWANFWGKQDEYTALADLYPELFKNGELVIENAKKLLETNNALDESQKEQIKNLVELKEKYDEAMKAVDEAISDTFGNIASDMTDVIWDSVVNGGEDAWERFGEIGSQTIVKLGKDLIQEMIITEYLEQYREQMRNAYGLNDATATSQALRGIVAQIFGGMEMMFDAGSAVAKEWDEWAKAYGFNLSENSEDTRKAATKSALGASQDSIDESNGRLATVQTHTFEMNENVKEMKNQHNQLVIQTAALLEHVQGIHSDTGAMRLAIADLNVAVAAIKSNVGTIVDAGVRVR